jgi:putative endonuclease
MREFHVYIMTNRSRTLYVGVTSSLLQRVYQHKTRQVSGFTRRYRMTRLVYYESAPDALSAIDREKQIKGWLRARKIALIELQNPARCDLSDGWFPSGMAEQADG